jgi:hypothetical protein
LGGCTGCDEVGLMIVSSLPWCFSWEKADARLRPHYCFLPLVPARNLVRFATELLIVPPSWNLATVASSV